MAYFPLPLHLFIRAKFISTYYFIIALFLALNAVFTFALNAVFIFAFYLDIKLFVVTYGYICCALLIYLFLFFMIHCNVTYEGFHILDYLWTKHRFNE